VPKGSRELTANERVAIDESYATYCKTAEAAKSVDEINEAWERYKESLSSLGVYSSLCGYRVRLNGQI
jgi:hypothetical protein